MRTASSRPPAPRAAAAAQAPAAAAGRGDGRAPRRLPRSSSGARAQSAAARARAEQARAPLLPQLVGTASWQRGTANYAPRPGSLPTGLAASAGATWDTSNYFNLGLNASWLVWDFGQTSGRWRAAQAGAAAQAQSARMSRLQVLQAVRTAFFTARAQQALAEVAREQLANQERHLAQVQGFVEVGTRPAIDLAQAKTDRANARVALITAENAAAVARAQLNVAMGVEGPTDFTPSPTTRSRRSPAKTAAAPSWSARRWRRGRTSAASGEQLRAQELSLRAAKGAYLPSVSVGTGVTDAGVALGKASPGTGPPR